MKVRFNLLLAVGVLAVSAAHADVRSDAHQALLGDFAPRARAQVPAVTGGVDRGSFDVASGTAGVGAAGYNVAGRIAGVGAPGCSVPGYSASLPNRSNVAPLVAPTEDRVDKFFRTGILVGDRPADPAKKISVGPCEGGQLLNLRSSW